MTEECSDNACPNTIQVQWFLMLPGKGSYIQLHIHTISLLAFLRK